MAVASMSRCGTLSGPRILTVFLVLCALFLTKGYWLPTTPDASWRTGLVSKIVPEYASDDASQVSSHEIGSHHAESQIEQSQPTTTTQTVTVTHSTVMTATSTPVNDDECSSSPDARRVMVIMKTGASELEYKLPTHLITLLKCVPEGHFTIFSDMAQTFADYPIYDAVRNVSAPFREKHEDFELYRKLEKYRQDGTDVTKLKGGKSWNLDKWKFLPMMHATFDMSPDYIDWFLFIEADTSLCWLNLLQWLRTMDARKEYYLGAQNVVGESEFGHGGSGFVLSRAALQKLEEGRQKEGEQAYDERWEGITATSCCGDEILARALREVAIPLTHAWPVLQGERPSTVDYTARHWCTPPITMHHVSPVEVDELWRFQTAWVEDHGWDTPYLWRDVYAQFVSRHIKSNRTAWNNLSQSKKLIASSSASEDELRADWFVKWDDLKDYEQRATEDFDKCAEACTLHSEKCLQWQWESGRCYLGHDIRVGSIDDRESSQWTSGWHQERIKAFIDKQSPCKLRWND